MKPIAIAKGVKLYCPREGRFAFYNSPYPAHKTNTSVDIYPNGWFGGKAPSPVDGKVMLIRRVKAPKRIDFIVPAHEPVIILENSDNPETVTKILHVDPLVNLGDYIRVGDPIGTTLRSGYYSWATSPHCHIEIRSIDDPIRARGGYNLCLIKVPDGKPLDKIAGTVIHLQPEFALVELKSSASGIIGTVNGKPSILDGGIPHYGWLGAHLENSPRTGTIELLGRKIADITQRFSNSCKGECRKFKFMIRGQPILGLSFTLLPNRRPVIKLIPLKRNDLDVKLGEWVDVELIVS